MRTKWILVILYATLSTVTLAGPEAGRHVESDVTKLLPIRYDGYKYGYSSVGDAATVKRWDNEYPPRYGGDGSSLTNIRHGEEHSVGKPRVERGYGIEDLEEELTKAFLDSRGKSTRENGNRREEYYNRQERFVGGGGHGSGHGGGGEHHGSSGVHASGHGGGSEHHGSSGVHASGHAGGHSSGGGHMEGIGGHAKVGGDVVSSLGHSSSGVHTSSSEKPLRSIGHSNGGAHMGSSGEHRGSSGGHESGVGHIESGGGHQEKHHAEPKQHGRHEDRHEGRYGSRYGHTKEHHLLRDRLPYSDEQTLIDGFINAGRHKNFKSNYEEHENKDVEKGIGFIAHKDTSDEHHHLKSYYLKDDSHESYEYNPYRSYRPYGYRKRYEHSSEESKEYYGYKGIYFGSHERTGFLRDFIKSKSHHGSYEKSHRHHGSHEKSHGHHGSHEKSHGHHEKSKGKSIGKAYGVTKEHHEFVKDIIKDLEKGLHIKSKSKEKGDHKEHVGHGDKKGKGNNNGLFGGDLVNVIKVTFDHEEKKAEVKGHRRRRSTTRDDGKFLDPNVI